jgi:hypothetical protein
MRPNTDARSANLASIGKKSQAWWHLSEVSH